MRSIRWRCMQGASIIVALTLIFGWLLPIQPQDSGGKAFWDQLNNVWANALTGHLSWNNFTSLLNSGQQSNFFGDSLTISDSIHLPTGEILRYQSISGPNLSHYLEGFTFNAFDGRTWTSSIDDSKARTYQANDLLPEDIPDQRITEEGYVKVTFTLPPDGTKNYLFAPPNPRLFSVPSIVYSDGNASAWVQQRPLTTHETYEVTFIPSVIAPDDQSSLPSFSSVSEHL